MRETTGGGELRGGAGRATGGSLSDRIRALLPDGAIASVTEEASWLVRCRIIPGHCFERVVHAQELAHGELKLYLSERYQPRDDLTEIGSTRVSGAGGLAAGVRALVTLAEDRESQPPWRDAYEPALPDWRLVALGVSTDRLRGACDGLSEMATVGGTPLYMWQDDARDLVLARNLPTTEQSLFWSVNPRGEWSAHMRSPLLGDVTSPRDTVVLRKPMDPIGRAAAVAARLEPDPRPSRAQQSDAAASRPASPARREVEEPPPGLEQAPGGPVQGP